MWVFIIGAGILLCAFQSIITSKLLHSAMWLAGASALTALLLYLLGAPEIAVIELSVGAGLVTVLFVFAINIAGEEAISTRSFIPRPLAWALVVIAAVMFFWLCLPLVRIPLPQIPGFSFTKMLWEDRSLDVILQVVLIFCGVLSMMGLLSEEKPHDPKEKQS